MCHGVYKSAAYNVTFNLPRSHHALQTPTQVHLGSSVVSIWVFTLIAKGQQNVFTPPFFSSPLTGFRNLDTSTFGYLVPIYSTRLRFFSPASRGHFNAYRLDGFNRLRAFQLLQGAQDTQLLSLCNAFTGSHPVNTWPTWRCSSQRSVLTALAEAEAAALLGLSNLLQLKSVHQTESCRRALNGPWASARCIRAHVQEAVSGFT